LFQGWNDLGEIDATTNAASDQVLINVAVGMSIEWDFEK
jgi:hypothetical protein